MKFTTNCADCFAGLATKSRIGIVNLLLEKGRLSVSEIAGRFSLTQPTISHHLQYLKEAGIVSRAKRGRQVYYSISRKCKEGECGLFTQ